MARRVRANADDGGWRTKPPNEMPVEVKRQGIDILIPEVREAALDMADGDVSRIEVVSKSKAVIH
jgi:hypothetical protein